MGVEGIIDPLVKELIVLQIIYSLLLPKVTQDSHPKIQDNEANSAPNGTNNGGSNASNYDNVVISSNIKLSLVKLTNEIQNNILINQIMTCKDQDGTEVVVNKLNINDILGTIKELFPLQRIVLVDGQLSFHNLKIIDIKRLITEKYSTYRNRQIEYISKLEDEITKLVSLPMDSESLTSSRKIPSLEINSSNIKVQVPNSQSGTPNRRSTGSTTPGATTTTSANPITMKNTDPKREKLLQLYRDTVLNKMQSKNKILDKLYSHLEKDENNEKIVNELLDLERIKTTTPVSVHNLQLILQKSVSDGIMSSVTDGPTWTIARQVQTELDDTVQFMRRALE